ncbi:hypothetical protein A9973_25565 [Achromobacter sp. UMC46]|nr:hypothetical protein [Achromobacter sp. UMC46]
MAVAKWPPVRRPLLFGGGGGTKFPGGYAGSERIDHIQNAQGSVRCTLKIRDSPRIWFQPFKTLASHRIDDCAMVFPLVVRSQHSSISKVFYFTAGPLPTGPIVPSFLLLEIFIRPPFLPAWLVRK